MGKKLIYIITIILILSNQVYAYEVDGAHKTITIAGDNNLPPFEYMDNDIYKGFNLDIMRAIALEVGIEIEILPMNWYEAIEALNSGKVDAIQGMKFSNDRDISYDFSQSYIETSHSIFINNDNKYIYNVGDLKDKRVAIQKNDISKFLLTSKDIKNLIEVDNQEVALMMLINREIDAYVGNKLTGRYYIQKKGFENLVKTVGPNLMQEDYCVATLNNNKEVMKIFNKGITAIIENGSYDKIYNKWFGEKFYDNARKLRKYIIILGVAFVMGILILIVIVKWNRELKKKVDERTIELHRENILKEKILDSIFSAIIVIDNKKNILRYNDKAIEYLNVQQGEFSIEGTIIDKIIKDEDIIAVLDRGEEILTREVVCGKDKSIRTYEYNLCPITIDNSYAGGVISIRDITREKELRETLIAEDKLKSLGRIAATVAHEIKNPLTAIKAYVELIPQKIDRPKFRDKLLEDVPREIDRLDNFINDLLNYSTPKMAIKEDINIGLVVKNTLSLLRREADKYSINIDNFIDEDIYIHGSKNQIKQILMNLLINAIDAVKVRDKPYISIYAEQRELFIDLIIMDNGMGIDEDISDKIFEPYYTTKKDGVGLGLAITEQLIKKNDGEVIVSSMKDSGTKFVLTFKNNKAQAMGEINNV